MQITQLRTPMLVVASLVMAPSRADVDLRIESRPITSPIEAFVRVTTNGEAVAGLEQGDFAVRLDGMRVGSFTVRLPPDQDTARHLSIVLVMADGRAVESAIPAISRLPEGTFVAIVRARYFVGDPTPWLVTHPFTRIDNDAGSQSLTEFLELSIHDLAILRYGPPIPHLAYLSAGVDQLETPGTVLPKGPKAIVLVGNGHVIESPPHVTQSDLVARANAMGVPVFTIGTRDFTANPAVGDFMAAVAKDTGGRYLRGHTTPLLDKAYRKIWSMLKIPYRLAIPSARVTDCNPHMLEVTVLGESTSAPFVRCDTTPDPLVFRAEEGVRPGSLRVSNASAITGIESPVEIAVYGGTYSLGCNSSFTSAAGIARAGELVCVSHTASSAGNEATETTLVVGGVASSFYSTTRVVAP